MVKDFSALIVSVIGGLLVLLVGMMVFSTLYPYPMDLDVHNRDSMTSFLHDLPNKAYAIKIGINTIAVFCATLLAAVISRSKSRLGIIGLMLFVGLLIYRDVRFDYPDLYFVIGLTINMLGGLLGLKLGSRK
ncbi:MAG: hypothetical protein IPH94_17085 [Saprospiraceae bacterium]|nr:hypothetical protein [Saprospiraceae bacterium]MBK7222958.1 hypothetical protein [Saprospiraceae bacterium]MBK7789307.1 hypothetical protein [Saprospiraceae bacterium]MBK8112698.1 hypothetical protein [Saprospiraceae bacterium]MBK8852262.1 hypothetical protein [Saprospiraceae bacterium]